MIYIVKCEKCGGRSRIIDKRYDNNINALLRKRECLVCHNKYITLEIEINVDGYRKENIKNDKSGT